MILYDQSSCDVSRCFLPYTALLFISVSLALGRGGRTSNILVVMPVLDISPEANHGELGLLLDPSE